MKTRRKITTDTKVMCYDSETGEVISQKHTVADGKPRYKFEWQDLRALITVVNVILVMIYGLSIAWFGLVIGLLGIVKDITEIPDGRFRFSGVILHMSNVVLNIFFLIQYYG